MSKKRRHERERQRTTHDFLVEVHHFEIASGYDGLFRGAPEVTVAVGVYAVGKNARTLIRAIFRAAPMDARFPTTFPQVVPPAPEERAAVATTDDDAVLIVAAGIEDDGGGGVARVFGALERVDALTITNISGDHGAHVDVLTVKDVTPENWGEARRAHVMVDGISLQTKCVGDDFVGASAVCIARTPGKSRRHRFHLTSDDFVNDWTVVTSTRIGWRA